MVAKVFVFPILQSPHDVALIFWTGQLHTAWEFLHGNGGSERPAAWHGHWATAALAGRTTPRKIPNKKIYRYRNNVKEG